MGRPGKLGHRELTHQPGILAQKPLANTLPDINGGKGAQAGYKPLWYIVVSSVQGYATLYPANLPG